MFTLHHGILVAVDVCAIDLPRGQRLSTRAINGLLMLTK
jgi:hypothetical protein